MNFLSQQFSQKGLLIPYARDARNGNIVTLPGKSKKFHEMDFDAEIEDYVEAKHKGHLLCYDCDARVTFVKDIPSRAGSDDLGVAAHYTTMPNSAHWDTCETHQRREINVEGKTTFDKSQGFRVHVNSFGGEFVEKLNNEFGPASATGPYRRAGFKARLNRNVAEPMRKMETYSVNNIDDMIKFLSTQELSRIPQSLIIHRHYNIPFVDFMLSYDPDTEAGEHKKFQRFVRGGNLNGYRRQPVLMEIILDRPYAGQDLKYGRFPIESRPIILEANERRQKPIIIRPRLFSLTKAADWIGYSKKPILAFGIAKMTCSNTEDATEYHIDMRIHHADQIRVADLAEIRLENHRHQLAREKKRGDVAIVAVP